MGAERVAAALGGRRAGSSWMAPCPAHADSTPSLSLKDAEGGKVLVYCHAGCSQVEIIAALRARGLWHSPNASAIVPSGTGSTSPLLNSRGRSAPTTILAATLPADGTMAEAYLRGRGLRIKPPTTLRFHPRLRHPTGGVWPAMVAIVSGREGTMVGIHRTFLARDGAGKAPVEPAKMMLGPCRGGAVRLGTVGPLVMVGEGIETCLAAMAATGFPGWAALSTSGLRSVELPASVSEVVILADGDDPGEAAAADCARRLQREGRHVRIARPPRGMDFNDVLLSQPRTAEAPAP